MIYTNRFFSKKIGFEWFHFQTGIFEMGITAVPPARQGLAKWLIALPLACNQSIYVLKVVHQGFTFNLEPILAL